mmetsp:Transcript_20887/g.37018  ORF Transcript_20887/g.37018 Transcript_20887/m.37018 type:complete len:388 (+) Transcript_20887:84-1247(+)|eukprot:CAMPEP_0184522432 /NCGR_PEP_ID=MMETSP0198_2-20121128/8277_1 /TAXON_ID=1112570 /ORGANISM="Thraustochytrium sp., Strain LLF1b" /LENGTH=387 /DNA_ID=CAMNT_0026913255 /DNA_START=61 /DNA_END=1224 /DNA_ORIENTATION=-
MASSPESLKAEGNALMKTGDYDGAADKYTEAIELDCSNHILFSNRAAAYMKAQNFTMALADASRCVDMAPNWAKGHSRLGAAFEALNEPLKAENAYKKARDLGGVGTPSVASRTPSGGATQVSSFRALGVREKVLIGFRAIFFISSVLFAFGVQPGGFQQALLAVVVCYAIELYKAYGAPQRNQAYMQRVVPDFRAHFAMTALLFAFSGNPRILYLLPHFLAELGHIADATMKFAPGIAAAVAPKLNSLVLPRLCGATPQEWNSLPMSTRWTRYNKSVSDMSASLEVMVGISLIVEILSPARNLLLVFAYWHFLRVRYMVSPEIKVVFKEFDARILSVASRVPALLSAYQRIRGYAASLVAMPTQEEVRQRQEQGFMGNLRSSCVIS